MPMFNIRSSEPWLARKNFFNDTASGLVKPNTFFNDKEVSPKNGCAKMSVCPRRIKAVCSLYRAPDLPLVLHLENCLIG